MLLQAEHLVNRGEIRITKDGEAHCCVVTDSSAPTPVETFASLELSTYLARISGAPIPVQSAASAISQGIIPIHLGLSHRRATPSLMPANDQFEVLIQKKKVLIQGQNPRAVLFGVYTFLEQVGWLWTYPVDEDLEVPLIPTLKVQTGFHQVSHRVTVRNLNLDPKIEGDPSLLVRYIDWMAKNHFNGLGLRPDSEASRMPSNFSEPRHWPPLFGDAMSEIKKRGIQVY